MSTPQERNKAAVARMFAAFTAQDIPAVLEDMSEEVAWEQFELPTSAQVRPAGPASTLGNGWSLR